MQIHSNGLCMGPRFADDSRWVYEKTVRGTVGAQRERREFRKRKLPARDPARSCGSDCISDLGRKAS